MISARTLDGFKVRAKLCVHFPRAMANAEAEELIMRYARAFAIEVEGELSSGELPFEEQELIQRLCSRVKDLPRQHVRVVGLHVWHKGAISSRSMMAVRPQPTHDSPTVPAMEAIRPSSMPETSRPTRPNLKAATSSATQRPAAPSSAPQGSTPPSGRLKQPSLRPRSEQRPSRATATPNPVPRMTSGVINATEPRIRSHSGFSRALDSAGPGPGTEVGTVLAQPVRNAAATLLLGALDASSEALTDPMALLDGSVDAALRDQLISEACVCVCYVLYRGLSQTSLPQMKAIEIVQSACVSALHNSSMPVNEISRYLATENARDEFTSRFCSLLGTRDTPDLQRRLDRALRGVRLDIKDAVQAIEARVSQAGTRSA